MTAATGTSWVDRVAGNYNTKGLGGAAKDGWNDIKGTIGKDATTAQRGVVFGRVIGVGAGLAIAKGALESKTVEGEDRSALVRLGQFVLGAGVATASLVAGKGR